MSIVGILGAALIGAIGWLAVRGDYTQSRRSRRKELDRLFKQESALAAWTRSINKDRRF
jgi:hypothetical protein